MAFKLFPKVKRFPTLLGILTLIIGVAATTYLSQNAQQFFLKAEPAVSPQNVTISNLTQQSFTVSWTTIDSPSTGYVKYGKGASLGQVGLDDRDQKIDALGQYTVHYATLGSLDPKTTYYFQIVSQDKEFGNNGSAPYTVTTAPSDYSPASLSPTYGTVLEESGQPVTEGIVYVKINQANLLSTLVKPSGNWLVSLSYLTGQDFKNPLSVLPDDAEEISVRGKTKTSKVIVFVKNNAPVPAITLGKDNDFRTATSPTPIPEPSTEITPAPPTPTGTSSASLSVTSPASGAAIPGQPFFRGTGTPGEKIQIKVESENPITGEASVDQNGNWSWQPPANLSPGEHTLTIIATDSQGNLQTLVQKFIVLASGTQVVEAATPSATPTSTPTSAPTSTPTPVLIAAASPTSTPTPTRTPSPTPTPTPRPTLTPTPTISLNLTPTPTATTTQPPTAGDLLLTLILAGSGMGFITFGFLLKSRTTK